MVGLKSLFNTGASPRSGKNTPGTPASQDRSPLSSVNDVSSASSAGRSTPGATSLFSPDSKRPALLGVNHHFLGIERQLERLNDQFHSRPLSSISQFRYDPTNSWTARPPRHVDVIDALFSSHRYRIGSRSLSPTTPYNEDVADRNLHHPPVQRTTERKAYSRRSVIYQEDVADRNIASSSSLSSQKAWKPQSGAGPESMRRGQGTLNVRSRKLRGAPRTTSYENLHHEDNFGTKRLSRTETSLRPQVSAPDLTGKRGFRRTLVTSTSDSSDISTRNGSTERPDEQSINEDSNRTQTRDSVAPSSNVSVRDANTPDSSRPVSRKNVRDLSINTELASLQKPSIKIEHCAAQEPITNHRSIAQNASIAEIVNSPLPDASPSPVTPQPSPSYNVDEIMNMFKQAYITTQAASPERPTFETLQDAIVREINSHDAFRRVPVPDPGPPFTPPASQEAFDEDVLQPPPGPSRSSRNPAERESQFSKLIRKGPSLRKRGKSFSSTNNLKSHEKTSKRESQSSAAKRRHTYAQPPSADLIQAFRSNDPGTTEAATTRPPVPQVESQHQRPFYKYHLKRKSDPAPPSPGIGEFSKLRAPQPNNQNNRQSLVIDMTWGNREDARPHHHTEQITAVDDNNVTYILNATEPLTTPFELITASQKASKGRGVIERLEVHRSRSTPPVQMSKRPIPLRGSSLHMEQPEI
ncbi:hypothetical protein VTN77DRAFT_8247 [Rasamsonia byssochlamydoides]|uniref:uncharacterized protein n=1 Tax=Rasamsonia byssochlamydoides TaxID=89139 RepID=UPI003742555A